MSWPFGHSMHLHWRRIQGKHNPRQLSASACSSELMHPRTLKGLNFKRDPEWICQMNLKYRMCNCFRSQASYGCPVIIYATEVLFCPGGGGGRGANLSFPGRSHVGLLFTSEEQKKVGPCFRDFETSSFPPKKPKLNHKSTDKLLWVYFFALFEPVGLAMLLRSDPN